ncbi:Uncharacterized protein DAT39_009410, partial [Clarias magur]
QDTWLVISYGMILHTLNSVLLTLYKIFMKLKSKTFFWCKYRHDWDSVVRMGVAGTLFLMQEKKRKRKGLIFNVYMDHMWSYEISRKCEFGEDTALLLQGCMNLVHESVSMWSTTVYVHCVNRLGITKIVYPNVFTFKDMVCKTSTGTGAIVMGASICIQTIKGYLHFLGATGPGELLLGYKHMCCGSLNMFLGTNSLKRG